MASTEKTFVAALKEIFGFKEGQSASGFMQELKDLTQKDKDELYEDLQKAGIVCLPLAGYKK